MGWLQKTDCTRLRRYTRSMRHLPFVLLVLTVALGGTAARAQWQWIDRHGHPVFSDRPPPPDIPERDIRRQPGMASVPPQAAATPASVAASQAPAASRPSGEDKTLTEKARRAESAEAARRQAEQERTARLQAESCARARQTRAGLAAGGRVARTNEKGEREFLDEAGIAAEMQRIDAIIAADCK